MRILAALFAWELRTELLKWTPHVTFAVFVALGTITMAAIGGAFDGAAVAIGGTSGAVKVDAPFVFGMLTVALSLFGIVAHAGIAGGAASRDFGVGMHPLVFTTPISKGALYGVRLVTTMLVNLYAVSGITVGLLAGLPLVAEGRTGALTFAGVVAPYVSLVGPNVAVACVWFFALALLSRSMVANYLGGVGLLVAYLGSAALAGDLDNRTLASLLDPFGMQAVGDLTEYWTPHDQNTRALWPEGLLLANRALWLTLAAAFGVAALGLAPTDQTGWAPLSRLRKAAPAEVARAPVPTFRGLPEGLPREGWVVDLLRLLSSTRRSVTGILRNRYFFAFVFAAVVFLGLNASVIGGMYGTTTWPVTWSVLEVFGGSFALFNLLVITFYAGDLVWHERDAGMAAVVDASPVPGWVPYVSKLLALWVAVAVLQGVILLAGVVVQAFEGYTNFEIGLYLEGIYLYGFPGWALLCVLALTVHVLVDHKYLGHFVMVLYYAVSAFRGQFGFEHNLYFFGADPGTQYSDMNGWGWFSGPYLVHQVYWAGWAVVLAALSGLFWVRGSDTGWRSRLKEARRRARGPVLVLGGVGLAVAVGVGGWLFTQINLVHGYETSEQAQKATIDAEKRWRDTWYAAPQPRVVDVDLEVDLFPSRGDVDARGVLRLVNRTDGPIRALFVSLSHEAEVRSFTIDGGMSERVHDERAGIRIFDLSAPMMPGEERTVRYDLGFRRKGVPNRGAETAIVGNGSFVNSKVLVPSFGYDPGFELENEHERTKHGLPIRDRMLDPDDPHGRANSYLASDADWIGFRATVSTEVGQTALAPGYLERSWEEGDRAWFRYTMDQPILHFTAFLSADWEVTRRAFGDIPIEVYHDAKHPYNVERMIDATEQSLAVFERVFGPYQHRQVRIVEFPRYATFAQSFPNTIPYSEAIGFIARIDDEDDIDYPFYVTAHEVAHQWWAHQVIGANVKGSTMLSETLSQYAALLVMEQAYGPTEVRKFLDYERKSYLSGRASEAKQERPLVLVENQPYIHYNKGALVMWALADAMGRDRVNAVMAQFLVDWGGRGPPYPTAGDLVAAFRIAAPEHSGLIEDLFETITIYENKAVSATARALPDGRFEVTVGLSLQKLRADETGMEMEVPLAESLEIGLFREDVDDDEPLYLGRHPVRSGSQAVTVTVNARPSKAAIDPYFKRIDRHGDDNVVDVADAP